MKEMCCSKCGCVMKLSRCEPSDFAKLCQYIIYQLEKKKAVEMTEGISLYFNIYIYGKKIELYNVVNK
jgi:hypothetical protein